ncbi:MAG TPA: hypothetical protein VGH76_12730, partial [Actinomycetospora sp.]
MPARPPGLLSAPFTAPPGSVPPPRPSPPAGGPAQRSALSIGTGPRPDPDDDRTSLVQRPEPSVAGGWKNVRAVLGRGGPTRWGLLGL